MTAAGRVGASIGPRLTTPMDIREFPRLPTVDAAAYRRPTGGRRGRNRRSGCARTIRIRARGGVRAGSPGVDPRHPRTLALRPGPHRGLPATCRRPAPSVVDRRSRRHVSAVARPRGRRGQRQHIGGDVGRRDDRGLVERSSARRSVAAPATRDRGARARHDMVVAPCAPLPSVKCRPRTSRGGAGGSPRSGLSVRSPPSGPWSRRRGRRCRRRRACRRAGSGG